MKPLDHIVGDAMDLSLLKVFNVLFKALESLTRSKHFTCRLVDEEIGQ